MEIRVCIRINTGEKDADKRKKNEKELKKLCPSFNDLQTENLLDSIIKEVFPAGFEKRILIRNLTSQENNIQFGIRPIRNEGDFIDRNLASGQTLLFIGHRYNAVSIIDSIQIIQDTEKHEYEAEITVSVSPKPLPDDTSFIDSVANLESIRNASAKQLAAWSDYLKWRREIANKRIHGAKYFNFKYDADSKCVIFGLLFPSKEVFDKEKRYLKRDACIFNNKLSLDEWNFNYDRNLIGIDRLGLGDFQKFAEEHELKGSAEENPNIVHRHPVSREQDKAIEQTSETKYSEDDLKSQFKNGYIVYVKYKLPSDLIDDEDNTENQNEKSEGIEEIEKYLESIPKNGFIALSAAGEFALIRRFENAIRDLQDGNCYSQTLINWLFDVKKARVPINEPVEITKWANPNIAENENQKLAVEKAVNADELFLLQGPPGTGKTTVIAEIIYQLAIQGLRVLVSSQSNDAVDNALDRLSNNPAIRAIRLGGRGGKKKKKNVDEDQCKYIEKDALKYYYKSLSDSISKKYLDSWTKVDEEITQCQKDLRDCSLIQKDAENLRNERSKIQETLDSEIEDYKEICSKIQQKDENEKNNENLKRGFSKFEEFLRHKEPYDILPDELLALLESETKSAREEAERNMVLLPPNFMAAYLFVVNDLEKRYEFLKNEKNSVSDNSELENLNVKIKKRRREIIEAVEKDDDEKVREKKKELDSLKLQFDKLKVSGGVVFSEDEKKYLSQELMELCKSNKTAAIQKILQVCNVWFNASKSACNKMKDFIQSRKNEETSQLSERKSVKEGSIKDLRETLEDKNNQYQSKQNQLSDLRKKYSLHNNSTDLELEDTIKRRLDDLKVENEKSASLRNTLSDIMQEFCKKLSDEKTANYDNEYFLDSYINACNVVGISCTNNMRDLLEKGFDNFDVVIIDEVSKATPPELLIPLMKAGKVVLVGDHRQLPPMFEEHEKSYKEMIDEIEEEDSGLKEILTEENFRKYKNMVTASLFKSYFEQADKKIKHSLLTQYRMHSDIMNVINRFYEGRLNSGLSIAEENWEKAHNLKIDGIDGSSFIQLKNHVYWLDSSFLPSGTPINETFRENSTSACNILEKYIIVELLKKIAIEYKKQGITKENSVSVGVISFYQRQVNEIRSEVRKLKQSKEFKNDFSSIDIDVNTVDRFQGKEKNIIITSLVRNNKFGNTSKHVVTYERINVAFSRAQNLLFIVGAEHTYRKQEITIPKMDSEGEITLPVYANIIEDLKRRGCFAKTEKIIPNYLEKTILAEYKAMGGK